MARAAIVRIKQAWPATPHSSTPSSTTPTVIHTGQRGRPRKFPAPASLTNAPSDVVGLLQAIKNYMVGFWGRWSPSVPSLSLYPFSLSPPLSPPLPPTRITLADMYGSPSSSYQLE